MKTELEVYKELYKNSLSEIHELKKDKELLQEALDEDFEYFNKAENVIVHEFEKDGDFVIYFDNLINRLYNELENQNLIENDETTELHTMDQFLDVLTIIIESKRQ